MATATQKLLTVRNYQPEDEEAVIELLKMSLGDSSVNLRTSEFWHWKHIDNPFGPSFVRVSCDEDGQIAGLRAFMQWGLKSEGRTVRAVRAVDTSTHPEFRRMGIFSTLTKQVVEDVTEDGVDLIFNTPNQLSMPGYLKMGWQYVGALQPMIKVLSYPRFALGMANNKLRGSKTDRHPEESFFKGHVEEVGTLMQDESRLEKLILQSDGLRGKSVSLVTARSAKYLRWRYADHPNLTYYSASVEKNGELRGCAIFRTNTRFGLKEIVITELLLSEDDDKISKDIVKQIVSSVKADYIVSHFSEGSLARQALRKNGFRPVPKMGMDFTSRKLSSNLNVDPYALDNWDLTIGDIELF